MTRVEHSIIEVVVFNSSDLRAFLILQRKKIALGSGKIVRE